MVVQGRTHYSKNPRPIPKADKENREGVGEVVVTQSTAEEIDKYLREKYPYLEMQRELKKKKF